MIRTALRSLMILALVLTSIGLGAARGHARVAGQVVLCSGGAVTTVAVDQQGKPVKSTHLCPDMALSLLAAVASGPTQPLRDAHLSRLVVSDLRRVVSVWQAVNPQSRGPPQMVPA